MLNMLQLKPIKANIWGTSIQRKVWLLSQYCVGNPISHWRYVEGVLTLSCCPDLSLLTTCLWCAKNLVTWLVWASEIKTHPPKKFGMWTANNQPKSTCLRCTKINTPLVGLHHRSCVVKSVQVMVVYGDLELVISEYGSHLNYMILKNKQLEAMIWKLHTGNLSPQHNMVMLGVMLMSY